MNLFKTWLVERNIAHRGLHTEGIPENSLLAFENAIKNSCPVEFDVQQIADGTIVVFHDITLQRITGKDGYLKNLKKENLQDYKLLKTECSIPTFEEVLNTINGQVPILIEVKNLGKVGEMEKGIWDILKNYKGEYAIQSFNPFSLEWFKKYAPTVIRGQIASFFKGQELGFLKKFLLKRMCFNKKISEPHFISYDFSNLPNRYVKKYKHLPLISWTITSQEKYIESLKLCDNVIYENFTPHL